MLKSVLDSVLNVLRGKQKNEVFPSFVYFPQPLEAGVIESSNGTCICCKKNRGYLYSGPVYSTTNLHDQLCPWCIADGTAAKKFDASFNDEYPLKRSGMSDAVISQVTRCTPGYFTWQGSLWLSHCDDACELHGLATETDVQSASAATKLSWMTDYRQDETAWLRVVERYYPHDGTKLHKFVCRHCKHVQFGWDLM